MTRIRTGARTTVAMLALTLALGIGAERGEAQVAWDSPVLVHPHAPSGFGIFLADPGPGDGVAVLGTLRTAPGAQGLGFRVGIGEGAVDDLALLAGVDLGGTLLTYSQDTPLDLIWFTGAGAAFDNDLRASFPLGLVAGWDISTQSVRFTPFVGPRVTLDIMTGPGDDLELDGALDLGVDLAFDPTWAIRFGATVGDREALAVGVSLGR